MEKILVAMDPERTHLFAGNHALHLARRINARVFFLLILPDGKHRRENAEYETRTTAARRSVDALIEEARSGGIKVDYYMTHGDYESELVSFVQENKVTLLIMECPDTRGDDRQMCRDFLDKLRHRIDCRIEVVNVRAADG